MVSRALRLEVDPAAADALSDALLDAGAQSVTIESPHGPRPILSALFAESADPASALRLALEGCGQPPGLGFTVQPVAEEDWVRSSQAQFTPLELDRLWIGASWHTPPVGGKEVIRIDPGLAFGTGSHPTTKLVLRFLERALRGGERVLDYGCGSGILAILAKKCGANPVYGIDIDPQAVESARHNSERNRAEVTYGLPDECPTGEFDIVVANILSNPLKLMASMLSSKVKPGGRIALSGILARQADEVAQVYSRWIDIGVWREHEGWVCLTGTRRESH